MIASYLELAQEVGLGRGQGDDDLVERIIKSATRSFGVGLFCRCGGGRQLGRDGRGHLDLHACFCADGQEPGEDGSGGQAEHVAASRHRGQTGNDQKRSACNSTLYRRSRRIRRIHAGFLCGYRLDWR